MDDLRDWLLRMSADVLAREGGADAAHDVDHVARTMALAERLRAHEGGDPYVIWAAVALHDVGQERERRHGGDHAEIGAAMAGEILTGTRFPRRAVPAVQRAIREHRTTGTAPPDALEARILYDADKLDSLGAVGVARLYCITGLRGQKVYAPPPDDVPRPVPGALLRELRRDPGYSSSIEFDLLFDAFPDRLTTPTGRRLARERYAYMSSFFSRLRLEVEGQL